jgi:16S rRNA (guanine1207-N2)-methyltransferase
MSHLDYSDPQVIAGLRRDLEFSATLRGVELRYRTTWGLFSPREIDAGTRLLLDHMEVGEADRCLDLGCGYGPLGLTLARLAPRGHVVLVDTDFVAVDYSRLNARLNGIDNVEVLPSNGFSALQGRHFDLVATNLPAKSGKELYYLYLHDAHAALPPGGRLYVVTISGLRRFIARACEEVFGHYEKTKQGKDYTVALAVRQA